MAQQYSFTYSPPLLVAPGPAPPLVQAGGPRIGTTFLGPAPPMMGPGTVHVGLPHHHLVSPVSPRIVVRKEQPAAPSPHSAKREVAASAPPTKAEAVRGDEAPLMPATAKPAAPPTAPSAGDAAWRADSPRRAASPCGDSPGSCDSPRRAASPGADSPRRGGFKGQRSFIDLYEESFIRKQRLHKMQENQELVLEMEAKRRVEDFERGMKERRRLYRGKDTRTHLEREAELLRRREETKRKIEAERDAQVDEELNECTFQPRFFTRGRRAPSPGMSSLCHSEGADQGSAVAKLRKLAERQRMATSALRLVAADEAQLREDLRGMHAAMHERFQLQETQRVVAMLKRGDASSSTHGGLIQRVRATAAAGNDPTAVQSIIAELVTTSNQEIQRRTSEALEPKRLEAESELYERRVALVKELEAVEAEAMELTALCGGSLQHNAREAGIELGIAEHALRSLPSRPGMSLIASIPGGVKLHGTSTMSTSMGDGTIGSSRALQSQTPRSPSLECSPTTAREVDPKQPVKRRLEFFEEYAAAIAASRVQRPAAYPQVIVYR